MIQRSHSPDRTIIISRRAINGGYRSVTILPMNCLLGVVNAEGAYGSDDPRIDAASVLPPSTTCAFERTR